MRKVLGTISLLVLLLNILLTPLTYAWEYEEILEISSDNTAEEVVEETGEEESSSEFSVEEENWEEESGWEDIENLTWDIFEEWTWNIVEEWTWEVSEIGSWEEQELTGEIVEWGTWTIVEELTWFADELTWFSVELTWEMVGSFGTGEETDVEEINYNKEPILWEKTYDNVIVRVEALTWIFPEWTELTITPIKWWNLSNLKDKLVEEQEEIKEDTTVVAFDITFMYSWEEVQPKEWEKVKVTFDYSKNEDLLEADKNDNQGIKVYHIEDKDEEWNKLEDEEKKIRDVTNKEESGEEWIAVAEWETFSIYAIVTVSWSIGWNITIIHNLSWWYWIEDWSFESKSIEYSDSDNDWIYTAETGFKTPSKTWYMFMWWFNEDWNTRWIWENATDGMEIFAKWLEFWDLDVYILSNDTNTNKYHYTLMDRNMGAGSQNAIWYYYQWWNNFWFTPWWGKTESGKRWTSGYSWNHPYVNSIFYLNGNNDDGNWINPKNPDLWWWNESDVTHRQWPCPDWYHVPTITDWDWAISKWKNNYTRAYSDFYKDFLIVWAAYLARWTADRATGNEYSKVRYASSSLNNNWLNKKNVKIFGSDGVDFVPQSNVEERTANAMPVRCFKNTVNSSWEALDLSDIHLDWWVKAMLSIASWVVVAMQNPTKSGRTFEWWYTNDSYEWDAIETWDMVPAWSHLYAKWECQDWYVLDWGVCVKWFKITFNATKNGWITESAPVIVTWWITSKTIDLSNYTAAKTWFYFVWWNTWLDARRGRIWEKTFTESTKLYAIFLDLNTYTFEDEEWNILWTWYYESWEVSDMSKLLTVDYYSDETWDMSHYVDLLTLWLDDPSKWWKWTPFLPEDWIATGNLILHWEKLNKYTVTFYNDDWTDFLSYDVLDWTIIKEPVSHPEMLGYTFLWWYEDEELTTRFNFSSKRITSDTIIYPGFREVLCTFKIGTYNTWISINWFSWTQTEECLTHFVIPSEIEWKSVLRIWEKAFDWTLANAQIISWEIVLPDTLTSMGSSAFYKNNISWTLRIPWWVTTVNSYTFRCNLIEKVIFWEWITTIIAQAFNTEGCTDRKTIKNVILPSTLKTIWDKAFNSQIIEWELIIPDSVVSIAGSAFYGNKIWWELIIPDSVVSIGGSAFRNNQITWLILWNSVQTIWGWTFDNNQIEWELIIPNSVTTIWESAFQNNQLTWLILWNSVQTIWKTAFNGNKIEWELIIPDSVVSIGVSAFYNNNISWTLRIPWWVTTVTNAFKCNLIEEIIFWEWITTINDEAFRTNNCTTKKTIKKVTFPSTLEKIWSYAFDGQIIEWELIIPDSVVSIGGLAFYNNNISWTLRIPWWVTTVTDAFRCNPVEEVIFWEWIATINKNAFNTDGCTDKKTIKKVTFPSTLESIWDSAFRNQKIEWEFIFPESLTTLGTSVFRGNNISWTLVVPWRLNGGRLNGSFRCNLIENVIIEEWISVIWEWAFYDGNKDCTKSKHTIKSVQFPSSLTWIESNVFWNNQLTWVIIWENVETIWGHAFDNQYNESGHTLKSVILNDKLQNIWYRTFATNDIKSVYIPDSVETLDSQTFDQGNNSLWHKYITWYVTTKKSTLDYTWAYIKPLYQLYSYTFVNESGDILWTWYYPEILTSNTTKLIPLDYYNWIGNINDFTGVDELITSPEWYKVVWSTPLSENSVVTESLLVTWSVEKVHIVRFKNSYTGDVVEYVPNNQTVLAPEIYEVEGYTLIWWFSWDLKVDFPLQVTSDMTLVAKYIPNLYIVNFYDYDGENVLSWWEYEYGTEINEFPEVWNREGLLFWGWYFLQEWVKNLIKKPLFIGNDFNLFQRWWSPVSIIYNANWWKFEDNSNQKTIVYAGLDQKVIKYSHTPNIDDNGIQNWGYWDNYIQNDVITITWASSITVKLTYATQHDAWFWCSVVDRVCVKEWKHDFSNSCKERLCGPWMHTKEYTISWDSVTISFKSDNSYSDYYWYYAVISGNSIDYKSEYDIEDPINTGLKFDGWYKDQSWTLPFILPFWKEWESVYAKWKSYTWWNGCYKYSTLWTDDDWNLMVQIDDYSWSCEKENLVIPSTINVEGESYIVTSLWAGSFSGKALSWNVTLPSHLQSIWDWVFSMNPNITSVNIGEWVITIGNGAFQHNSWLKWINLPSTLKTIGDSAFYSGWLESIIIPDSVTTVWNRAFSNNPNLKTVKIGDWLTTLNEWVFQNCTSLETVELWNWLETISSAFAYDTELKNIIWGNNVKNINWWAFYNTAIEELEIPDSVVNMNWGAFWNNPNLRVVKLWTWLKYLYDWVFWNCTWIETLDLWRVQSINAGNFVNTQITWLVIPDTVTSISNWAFSNNTKLKAIKLWTWLETLSSWVFWNCTWIETLDLWRVQSINAGNFANTQITWLVIPDTVTYISDWAFSNNTKLKTVKLWTWLEILSSWVFWNCTWIETLDLWRVQSIYAGNFVNTQITWLVIPDTVTYIQWWAFADNTKLKTVKLWTWLKILYDWVFNGCTWIETLDLWRVQSISAGNFVNTQITWLVIPDTVAYIAWGAFADNTKLKTIKFWTWLKNLHIWVFSWSFNIESLDLWKLETIDNYNFSWTQITWLVIPDSVKTIYSYSFVNNTKLRTVTFWKNVELISNQAFANSAITWVTIPASLTALWAWAFCLDNGTNTWTVVWILSENSSMTAEEVISAHRNVCLIVREKPHTVTYDAASHSWTIGGNKTKEVIVNDNDIIQFTWDWAEIAVSERGYQFIWWTNVLWWTEPLIEEQTITSDITFYPIFKKDSEQRTALFSWNWAILSWNSEIEISCTIPAVYNTWVQETMCPIITPDIQRDWYEILWYATDKNHKATCSITWNQEVQIAWDEVYYAITKKNLTAIFNKNWNLAQTKYWASETTEGDIEEICDIWNQETECEVRTPSILPSTDKTSIWYTTSTTSSWENLTWENVKLTLSEPLINYYAWTQSTPQEVKVNYVYSTWVVQWTTIENNCWTEVRYNWDENQTWCIITLPVLQVRTGYVTPKWYRTETEVVETDNENKTMFYYANSPITLTWRAEISWKISYLVKHYFQMLENDSITNKYVLNQSYTDIWLSWAADTILILSWLKKEIEWFEYFKATVNGQPVNDIIDISQAIGYAETHQLTTPVEIKLLYERNKYEYLLNQQTNVSTEWSTLSNANMYYGQTVILSWNVTNDCYDRSWWQWLPENVVNVQQTSFTMPAGNVTITPIVKDKTYTIVFDKNAQDAEWTVPDLENVKCSDQIQLDSNKIYTRNGYEFKEWNTNSDWTWTGYSKDATITTALTKTWGAVVTLYAQWTANKYIITFDANGWAVSETDRQVTFGEEYWVLPVPTREWYTFSWWYTQSEGWEYITWITKVTKTENHTLYAQWKIRTYTITWKNSTWTVLETDENVPYWTMPSYDWEEPISWWNVQYTYAFSWWTPATWMVVWDQVYTATYETIVNKYAITFVDEDGTELKAAKEYEYNTPAESIEKPADPTKTADAQYTYSFVWWTPEVHNVTWAQVYTATYNKTINKYSVLWKNRDWYVLETDENVEYGSKPKYDWNTPLSGETVEYQYRFAWWDPSITNETIIEWDTVYTATYESIKRKYQITWKDYDDQIIDTTEVEYWVIPTHVNPIRTWHEFNTWDPSPVEVTWPTTYKATYTIKQYTVTPEKWVWVDDILWWWTYDYGSEIVLTWIAKEWYHFEWWVTVKEFTVSVPAENITFKINAQPNIYYVHFKNNGWEWVMNNQAFTYDQEQALTPNAYIRNWFTFVSWTDGEWGIYKDKAVVKNLITSWTINLIAQWIEWDVPGPTPPSPTPTPGWWWGGWWGWKSIDDKTEEKQHDSAEDKQHDSAEDKQQERESKDEQINKDEKIYTWWNVETLTWDSSIVVPEPVYEWTEEELTAYKYAYKYWITTLAPEYAAMPDDYVQRWHMAKMVVNYALNVLHRKLPEKLPRECRWLDWRNAWESQEIKDYAEKACALWIMWIDMKYFQPKKYVTRAQFWTIIWRLMWWKLTSKPYYAWHLSRLKERWIMTQIENPENRIEIRKWAWLMFMRMEKYIM